MASALSTSRADLTGTAQASYARVTQVANNSGRAAMVGGLAPESALSRTKLPGVTLPQPLTLTLVMPACPPG
jgi:hypothetical protein